MDCDDLQVSNGTVDLSNGTRFPAVAIYMCNRGYNISDTGDIVRTCLANGTWSGTPIECIGEWGTCIMYHWYIDEILLETTHQQKFPKLQHVATYHMSGSICEEQWCL